MTSRSLSFDCSHLILQSYRDSYEHGIILNIYLERINMVWQFIQLFPVDIVDEFVGPDKIEIFPLTEIFQLFNFFKRVFIGILPFGDVIVFFSILLLILVGLVIFIWKAIDILCSLRRNTDHVLQPHFRFLLYDVLYIPILDSLVTVFACI